MSCRYLPELTLSENINLPPTLLSRFDLVYLVLDKHDEDRDRKLAKHLVSLFWADAPEQTQPVSWTPLASLRMCAHERAGKVRRLGILQDFRLDGRYHYQAVMAILQ